MKRLVLILFGLLLFGVTFFNGAFAAKKESLTWSIQPSEAYDAIMFLGKLNPDYNLFSQLPNKWEEVLGEEDIKMGEKLAQTVSTADLSYLLTYLNVKTLDDLIKVFGKFSKYEALIRQELSIDDPRGEDIPLLDDLEEISKNQQLYLRWFKLLKENGFHEEWKVEIEPFLLEDVKTMQPRMEKYSIKKLYEINSNLLKVNLRSNQIKIYLTEYSSLMDNNYQLPRGGMICPGRGWFDFSKIIHKSLCYFPGNGRVIKEIKLIYNSSPSFKKQCDITIFKRNNYGFEEVFLTGVELYLSEQAGFYTTRQIQAFIKDYKVDMPLTIEIYQALHDEKPDLQADWQGYGAWLLQKIQAREFPSLK